MTNFETFSTGYDSGYEAAISDEQQRIIELIQNIRDTWQRTPSFNYRIELNNIIAQIKGEK
jgi:hypothetical protein